MKRHASFSKYDNGKFIAYDRTQITLLPEKELLLKTENDNNKTAHLLWSDGDSLSPLATKRISE